MEHLILIELQQAELTNKVLIKRLLYDTWKLKTLNRKHAIFDKRR